MVTELEVGNPTINAFQCIYYFAAFCMNREQKITSARTHPTDFTFM